MHNPLYFEIVYRYYVVTTLLALYLLALQRKAVVAHIIVQPLYVLQFSHYIK